MKPLELIGIALYSDDEGEIVSSIKQCLSDDSDVMLAACARSIGHLARRFKVDAEELRQVVESRARDHPNSPDLPSAIVDMNTDVLQFVGR